jgi:hypothetical protein
MSEDFDPARDQVLIDALLRATDEANMEALIRVSPDEVLDEMRALAVSRSDHAEEADAEVLRQRIELLDRVRTYRQSPAADREPVGLYNAFAVAHDEGRLASLITLFNDDDLDALETAVEARLNAADGEDAAAIAEGLERIRAMRPDRTLITWLYMFLAADDAASARGVLQEAPTLLFDERARLYIDQILGRDDEVRLRAAERAALWEHERMNWIASTNGQPTDASPPVAHDIEDGAPIDSSAIAANTLTDAQWDDIPEAVARPSYVYGRYGEIADDQDDLEQEADAVVIDTAVQVPAEPAPRPDFVYGRYGDILIDESLDDDSEPVLPTNDETAEMTPAHAYLDSYALVDETEYAAEQDGDDDEGYAPSLDDEAEPDDEDENDDEDDADFDDEDGDDDEDDDEDDVEDAGDVSAEGDEEIEADDELSFVSEADGDLMMGQAFDLLEDAINAAIEAYRIYRDVRSSRATEALDLINLLDEIRR